MGGKGSAKVYDYLLSVHYGICHGPIDSINQVRINDKRVWCGSVTSRRDVCIDLPELFGGDGKEGGPKGVVECYMGGYDQVSSDQLASRLGGTPTTVPGYRGISGLFFRGNYEDGFKWITNNPYLPSLDVSVTKIYRELNSEFATVWPLGRDEPEDVSSWAIPLVPDGETYTYSVGRPTHEPIPGIGPSGPRGPYYSLTQYENAFCGEGVVAAGFDAGTRERSEMEYDEDTGEPLSSTNMVKPSPEEIDAGTAELHVRMGSVFRNNFPDSGFPGLGVIQYYVWYYEGAVDTETGELIPGDYISMNAVSRSGTVPEVNRQFQLPAGTRFIRQYFGYNAYPLSSWDSMTENTYVNLKWEGMEYGHCQTVEYTTLPDANPANFLYELLTNYDWGGGEAVENIDVASFQAASETLFTERMGISFTWVNGATNEDIAQEVIDHIKGFMFQDPYDGKWTLRLLRKDYDPETVPEVSEDDCEIMDGRRPLWGETTNEIVVTYTDPATEETATVTSQLGSGVAIQPGISSDSRNYYMFRNPELAQVVADRDRVEAAYPLWSGSARLSRKFWDIRPGDRLKLVNYADQEIESMICVVMSVKPGRPGSRAPEVQLTEDIYAVDTTTYREPQRTNNIDTSNIAPEPLTDFTMISAPYPFLRLAGLTISEIAETLPGQHVVPMGNNRDIRIADYETWVQEDLWRNRGRFDPNRCQNSTFALIEEDESEIPRSIIDAMGSGTIFPGDFIMFGDTDRDSEIVKMVAFAGFSQTWIISRGMFDTVPRAWPIGTRVWRLPDTIGDAIGVAYLDGDTLAVRNLPRVGGSRLAISATSTYNHEVVGRSSAPVRPAACQIVDGLTGFGFDEAVFEEPFPSDITVEWVNRNRFDEDAIQPNWNGVATGPEPGQTTVIRVRSLSGDLLASYTAPEGDETLTFPASALGSETTVYVEFIAELDGIESIQFARRRLRFGEVSGWGYDWGNSWS